LSTAAVSFRDTGARGGFVLPNAAVKKYSDYDRVITVAQLISRFSNSSHSCIPPFSITALKREENSIKAEERKSGKLSSLSQFNLHFHSFHTFTLLLAVRTFFRLSHLTSRLSYLR
jgi:hypothetical protein